MTRAISYWHHVSAWVLGPLLVGLIAVGLAMGSEHANDINKMMFAAFPFAALLVMHALYGRGPFQTVELRRTLILAGGAASVPAAFNTPLAGIMFAIEQLRKKYVFTANSSTLITVIVMTEMTDSYHMLLPLMAASVIASGVSKIISPIPLYHALAKRFSNPPSRPHSFP